MKDETVWLNVEQMAQLIDRDVKTIRKYIYNALKEEIKNEVVLLIEKLRHIGLIITT